MRILIATLAAAFAAFLPRASAYTDIEPVPVNPAHDSIAGSYSVQVDDGLGHSTTALQVVNHSVEYPKGTVHENCYFTHFSFGGGNARVTVTLNNYLTTDHFTPTLSPKSYNNTVTVSGNQVSFTAAGSGYFVLKVTDTIGNKYPFDLIILADNLEAFDYGTPPPAHGTGIFNIDDYGAAGDYSTNCNSAFVSAIAAAASYYASSGIDGIVYVPGTAADGTKGQVYLINAPIIPKSHIKMYLAPGAIVRADIGWTGGVSNWNLGGVHTKYYLIDQNGSSTLTDFMLYGRGTLDCRGVAVGGYADQKADAKPLMGVLDLVKADHVTVDGVVFREATGLTDYPDDSSYLTFRNTKVINYSQSFDLYRENDAFDVVNCSNSSWTHLFAFTADDALCIKGGASGDTANPVSNCNFFDCVIYTLCAGCKYGTGAYTNITNSYFKNIDIVSAKHPLDIETSAGATCTWSNIGFLGVTVEDVNVPEGGRPMVFYPANGTTNVSNVQVTDVHLNTSGPNPSEIEGGSGSTINGVHFVDLWIAGTEYNSITGTNITTNSGASNITFHEDPNCLLNLTPLTPYTNWVASGSDSILVINDGITTSQGQATALGTNVTTTYNFSTNQVIDYARLFQDFGTYGVAAWQLDYKNTSGSWVTIYPLTPITNPFLIASPNQLNGWNEIAFPPVTAQAVRFTFQPFSSTYVGVNDVEVRGDGPH